jgi:hypothetical protein
MTTCRVSSEHGHAPVRDLGKRPLPAMPGDRKEARDRAERDLLEGGVEEGDRDFYEPDL